MTEFAPDFFKRNRASLQKLLKDGDLLVMAANGLMQRSTDTAYSFRQDSSFFYLTGLETANAVLVMDPKTDKEFLILPNQTDVEKYFGGALDRDEIAELSGIDEVLQHRQGWERLKEVLRGHRSIRSLPAPPLQFTRQERLFTSPARRLLIQKLRRISELPIVSVQQELMTLRRIKQAPEIEAIEQAIAITSEGIHAARSRIATEVCEYELEAEFDYVFKRHGSRHGFAPPIVASGPNTTILHYLEGRKCIKQDDLVLFDVGAEVSNYSADISRTYKVGNVLSSREHAVMAAVMAVHHRAIDMLKEGVMWSEFARKVDELMGKELVKLKLINTNTRANVRPFFPHSIGHSLGLDVHDVNDYRLPLQRNMVLAIEPGIYIPGEGIGVRIEDNIQIGVKASKNLSGSIAYS